MDWAEYIRPSFADRLKALTLKAQVEGDMGGERRGLLPVLAEAMKDVFPTKQEEQANLLNRRLRGSVMRGYPDAVQDPLLAGYHGKLSDLAMAGMTVYHGSPHKFDKFDMSKVGTGEGAQAYGHGLYLAENPGVAGGYARGLSKNTIEDRAINFNDPREVAALEVHLNQGNMARSADSLYRAAQQRTHSAPSSVAKKASELLDAILEKKLPNELPKIQQGSLYKVDLPDEHIAKMLDWDKPLSQQPEAVKTQLKLLLGQETFVRAVKSGVNGGELYSALSAPYARESIIPRMGSKEEVTAKLRSLGIPGIKYLDQGSRGTGQGTRNFVIFDENIAKILGRE